MNFDRARKILLEAVSVHKAILLNGMADGTRNWIVQREAMNCYQECLAAADLLLCLEVGNSPNSNESEKRQAIKDAEKIVSVWLALK